MANQACSHVTVLLPDAHLRGLKREWLEPHRAGVPVPLIILHSALLL
jgi:hypothetical protein